MTQPDVGDVHVNALLSNMSIAHYNQLDHYVADRVFPAVFVDKRSDIYPVYTRGFFFADEGQDMVRAPGTNAAVAGFEIDTSNTYTTVNFAVAAEIPDELRGNADAVFNLDNDVTRLLTQLSLIRRERAWSADFMTDSVWGTTVTGTTDFTKWNDFGASDPLTDLEDGLDSVEGATGFRPNKLVMGAIVWRRLKHHPDLVDRIKGGATSGAPALVNRQLLAQLLEIDEVLVGRASYRSTQEGDGTLTLARIIDDDALLLYAPKTPGLMEPTAGATFVWQSMVAPGAMQFMRKGRENRPRKDWFEVHSYFDHVATETEGGYFFADVVD